MILQLKNGKCIYLTINQYLALTDELIDDLMMDGFGSYTSNPFHASILSCIANDNIDEEVIYNEIDESIDFEFDDEEVETSIIISRFKNIDNKEEDN